jgi:superfamily I DNA/RNA helicase
MAYFFKLPVITDLTVGQQAALDEPNAIAISGGPGTGKSVVALWRHIRNYGLGKKKSLLLTYTKTLERYLASSALSESDSAGKAVDRTYDWTTKRTKNYDEIIIDEAQDVEASRYDTIKKYSDVVSYGADDKQIVYQKKCTTESQLKTIFPKNKHHELDENFRNSYEILLFAKALFPNKLISTHTLNKLLADKKTGNKPILLITNNDSQKQRKALVDIINQFKSDTHNIAILVPLRKHVNEFYAMIKKEKFNCSKYESDDDELLIIENIHITTFKSSKGTEFDTVIIPDFQNYEWNIANLHLAPITENDYYVAITRARRNLYLISSTQLSFLDKTDPKNITYQKDLL